MEEAGVGITLKQWVRLLLVGVSVGVVTWLLADIFSSKIPYSGLAIPAASFSTGLLTFWELHMAGRDYLPKGRKGLVFYLTFLVLVVWGTVLSLATFIP